VLEVVLDLVLVTRVCVYDVPAEHSVVRLASLACGARRRYFKTKVTILPDTQSDAPRKTAAMITKPITTPVACIT
jgi:hypothetical protein